LNPRARGCEFSCVRPATIDWPFEKRLLRQKTTIRLLAGFAAICMKMTENSAVKIDFRPLDRFVDTDVTANPSVAVRLFFAKRAKTTGQLVDAETKRTKPLSGHCAGKRL
jgi:hypothetical protein